MNTIKNNDEELLTDITQVVERWKEYFQDLLNPLGEINTPEENPEEDELAARELEDGITREEIRNEEKKTKMMEYLLKGSEDMAAGCQEEWVPEDWCKTTIFKVFKNLEIILYWKLYDPVEAI